MKVKKGKEMEKKSIYEQLGVDPDKTSVKEIFSKIVRNDFPGSFVNIVIDPWDPDYVLVKHPDGSGSKSVTHIIYALETGDYSRIKDDAADAFVMNAGDIGTAGFFEKIIMTDVISINAKNVDKQKVVSQLAFGMAEVIALHKEHGIEVIIFTGGETEDLVDQENCYSINIDLFSRLLRKDVITGNVQAGDKIFGFASDGQARWEKKKNSGCMNNGGTMSRTMLLHKDYAKEYPFLCRGNVFKGRFGMMEFIPELDMTIADAILSPTRQWAILMKMVADELKKRDAFHLLHGMSLNTGGGAKKIINLGQGIIYVKEMPEPSPFFKLIQSETGESWRNMYKTYSMRIGLDVVGSPEKGILEDVIYTVSEMTNVDAFELGRCEKMSGEKNQVILTTPYGTHVYFE